MALIFARATLTVPRINSLITTQYLNDNPGAEIPWDYQHLYHRLRKEDLIGRGNDEDLVEFLNSQATRGTHTRFWTNPSSNAIEAIYWEMPGAKDKVRRGLNCVFYDTTHGTNHCKMKLGMFIASNERTEEVLFSLSP